MAVRPDGAPIRGVHSRRSATSPRLALLIASAVAAVVLAGASLALLHLIRSQGLTPTGDEPHYLVAAYAIGHYHTLTVGTAYQYAEAHNLFINWPKPPQAQVVPSHGRLFAFHEPGLPLLLAVPVAADGLRGAEVALILTMSVLTAWLCYLIGRVSAPGSPWAIATFGLFLFPASLLASTQVYPDLISGLLIAIVVMLVAVMEREKASTWLQLICCGLILGYLPWLHIQNALAAALLAAALIAVTWRNKLRIAPLATGLAVAVVMWALMAVYNDYVFGRPQGPGGNSFSWGALSWTRILALLIDRQQGFFIQFPVIVLALAAFWVFRRRIPLAIVVTVLVVIVSTLLSGTFINSFGGASFVGRFNWTVFPVLLGFAGLYFVELWLKRPQLGIALAAVTALLVGFQFVSVVNGTHLYYSTAWNMPPPPAGPAWWGPADRFLPSFAQLVASWRGPRVVWEVMFVFSLIVLFTYLAAAAVSRPRRSHLAVGGIFVVAGVVTLAGTAASAQPLMAPMNESAAALFSKVGHVVGSSRTVTGGPEGYLVYGPYWTLPNGTYKATVYYSLDDPRPDVALSDVDITGLPGTSKAGKTQMLVTKYLASTQSGKEQMTFSIGYQGLLEVRVFWSGTGTLTVHGIQVSQG